MKKQINLKKEVSTTNSFQRKCEVPPSLGSLKRK
jgi:hypothetical protein